MATKNTVRDDKRNMKKKQNQKYPPNVKENTWFKKIKPRNGGQKRYIECLNEGRIIVSKGPAGTGKTFIAASIAIEKLVNGEVDKIIICRPIVEAGEKLGFLPGDLEEKVHPYLLPLLDAFEDCIGRKRLEEFMQAGHIEIAPLAFMRGRTFNHAFAILDEAQNATHDQIKMFLTRLGEGSTFVINGDESQADVNRGDSNSLKWIYNKLSGGKHSDIVTCEFYKEDIVRDPLIGTVIDLLDAPD